MFLIEFKEDRYLDLEKVVSILLDDRRKDDKKYNWVFNTVDSEAYRSYEFQSRKEAINWWYNIYSKVRLLNIYAIESLADKWEKEFENLNE